MLHVSLARLTKENINGILTYGCKIYLFGLWLMKIISITFGYNPRASKMFPLVWLFLCSIRHFHSQMLYIYPQATFAFWPAKFQKRFFYGKFIPIRSQLGILEKCSWDFLWKKVFPNIYSWLLWSERNRRSAERTAGFWQNGPEEGDVLRILFQSREGDGTGSLHYSGAAFGVSCMRMISKEQACTWICLCIPSAGNYENTCQRAFACIISSRGRLCLPLHQPLDRNYRGAGTGQESSERGSSLPRWSGARSRRTYLALYWQDPRTLPEGRSPPPVAENGCFCDHKGG